MTTLTDAVKSQLRAQLEAESVCWNHMPLKVAIMLHGRTEEQYRSAIQHALVWWTSALGFQAFIECDVLDQDWDVDVMFLPANDKHVAVAWHEIVNGKLIGHIELRQFQDVQTVGGATTHEGGHILGLPHCDGTIMSATMEPVLMGNWYDYRGELRRDDRGLADFQRKRLRKRYHDVPERLADLAGMVGEPLTDSPNTTVEVEKPPKK